MKKNIITFLCAVAIALALGYSQISRPQIVLGFLNLSENWDPTILISYGTALVVYMLLYHLFLSPGIRNPFQDLKSGKERITKDLLLGATIFGIGWGMTGICPGPAIIGLTSLKPFMFVFVIGMVLGMQGVKLFFKKG